ncbi:hypothetical protein F4778DRAFT_272429 [Xylariomycetidae sp. FL2044]|nr:hypothetical protein F4778DRAFT_272429 [Xylariomycetidae sp. FL2044]
MTSKKVEETLATLEPLLNLLDPKAIITPSDSSAYKLHAEPYAIQKDLHPAVVLVPDSAASLSMIVGFLYMTNLDFNVRGGGFKSPSARDVIISMKKFDTFEYDSERKLATVGVGAIWAEVAENMARVDPEYTMTIARTPAIGVGGAILNGGYSWMSTEFGCICDPANFIDAEIVKYDGSIVKASQEPDLLWALRGSGGGFGIMTNVILKAHRYPIDIWSGLILVPRRHLRQLASDIETFTTSTLDPKITFFMYLAPRMLLPIILEKPENDKDAEDMFILHVYDALGEEHGRKAFSWALDKSGTIDRTTITTMKGVVDMQANAAMMRGTMKFEYAPMCLEHISANDIVKTIEWHDGLGAVDPEIQERSMFVFEMLINRPPLGDYSDCAWPRRPHFNHLLLLIGSSPRDGPPEQGQTLRRLVGEAPVQILGEAKAASAAPNPAGLEPDFDASKVFGEHYEKLVMLRKKYDPQGRFKALI